MGLYEANAKIFKALSDATRLEIVDMLSCGEMCACDILEFFQITQPTLSYHMKILTDCGVVVSRKEGLWMRYRINDELCIALKEFIQQITTPQESCICHTMKNKRDC